MKMFQRINFINPSQNFNITRKFTHFIDKLVVLNQKDNTFKVKRESVVDEEVNLFDYASSYNEDTKVSNIIKNMDVRSSAFDKSKYYDSTIISDLANKTPIQGGELSTSQLASIKDASSYLNDEVNKAIAKYKKAIEDANKKLDV